MKKLNYLMMSCVAMAGAILTSCSAGAGEIYNEEKVQEAKHDAVVKEYEENFIKKFGPIAPTEKWDFSVRGSELVPVASTRKKDEDYLSDWRKTDSYGYVWNYPEKAKVDDPMPENDVNSLFDKYFTNTIVPAINETAAKAWNPSGKIIFRALATTRTDASKSKYFAIGIEAKGYDLYLRLSSPANAVGAKRGTTVDQHTSSLDFSQIPSGSIWYACSTTGQNKNKISINASDYKLNDFKEVNVTIENKVYTFWCFKCDKDGSYADLVLWVQKADTTPVLVDCKRYFVEDLGSTGDHDFNDVVFDVALFSDGRQTCYVRALGGTLDITIKVGTKSWTKSSQYNPKEMLNTSGNIDYSKCLAEFDVTGWNRVDSNVSVDVEGKDGSHYGLPFPEPGKVPFIIATFDGKHWRAEKSEIPSTAWFSEPNE